LRIPSVGYNCPILRVPNPAWERGTHDSSGVNLTQVSRVILSTRTRQLTSEAARGLDQYATEQKIA